MNISDMGFCNDYLLVDEDSIQSLRDLDEEQKESNVALPETREDYYPETGTILKVGPGRWDKKQETFINNPYKEGTHIMFHQRAGQLVIIDGKKYRLLRESDVYATI